MSIAEIYAALIKAQRKTLDEVPERIRPEVKTILDKEADAK